MRQEGLANFDADIQRAASWSPSGATDHDKEVQALMAGQSGLEPLAAHRRLLEMGEQPYANEFKRRHFDEVFTGERLEGQALDAVALAVDQHQAAITERVNKAMVPWDQHFTRERQKRVSEAEAQLFVPDHLGQQWADPAALSKARAEVDRQLAAERADAQTQVRAAVETELGQIGLTP